MPSAAPAADARATDAAYLPPTGDTAAPRLLTLLDRLALAATLLTPPFLMHGHAIAEVTMGIASLAFLIRCGLTRHWRWLRQGWVPFGLAWWGWIVICSLPLHSLGLGEDGPHGAVQAIVALRFLTFVAALEHSVLRPRRARLWMAWVNLLSTLWICASALLQFATGHNQFGDPRGSDGELTGPFDKARAGPPLAHMLPPAVIPPVDWLLRNATTLRRIGAGLLLLASVAVMVLIGQRMPLLLTAFGLVIAGLLMRRLRAVVGIALAAGILLTAATVVVSPPTYHRLVDKFSSQMDHFSTSPYGMIYGRAVAMAEQHPITGRGFDGYRTGCRNPRYWHGWFEDPATQGGRDSPDVCLQHPHNYYLEALTNGGLPGLVLFAILGIAWLAGLARGLGRDPQPRQVGLFVSAFISIWPLASTSAFTSMPMGGWFFLMLGWGLAEARHGRDDPRRAL